MRIAVDAMGTDLAPTTEVEGAIGALRQLGPDLEILLIGDRDQIEAEIGRHEDVPHDRLSIVHASERVSASDSPSAVLRKKPDSSIVVGLKLHGSGEADAFLSAGSTGAVMAGSLFILKRLEGVDRPTVGTTIPTASGPLLMLDAGTNVDCKPQHLVQFAHLGKIYAQDLMKSENPRIGLLSVGSEPEKGDETTLATHALLRDEPSLNFIGNVEGRDVITGGFEVLVCDGFVGNVLLKFYEAAAGFLMGTVGRALKEQQARVDLSDLMKTFDWAEYGGAPLLGVNGVSIICHGHSPPAAIQNGIREAYNAVRSDLIAHMRRELAATTQPSEETT